MKADEILKIINPPIKLSSFSDINELYEDSNRLTLIEMKFFEKIKSVINEICLNEIEGDVVNIGVFKGGASLYMKALFEENEIFKKWWLYDSFKGFNEQNIQKKKDINVLNEFSKTLHFSKGFPTASDTLKLFKRFNLSDNLNVIEGYIEHTLKGENFKKISFLHIDVDFYEPTFLSLNELYHKLSPNAWVVIDDYNVEQFECKLAVDDFRRLHNINSPIEVLGNYQIGWKKE